MRHAGPVHMQHMNVVPCKDVVDYLHHAVDFYMNITKHGQV